jgi:hypothetical protein
VRGERQGPSLVTVFDRCGTQIALFNEPKGGSPRYAVDRGGRIMKAASWTVAGGYEVVATFAYNGDCIASAEIHTTVGELLSRTTFEYTSQRLSRAVTRRGDGALERERRITYDGDGRVTERITCDRLGCFDRETFEYDRMGRIITRVLYYPDGSTTERTRQAYEYGDAGRLVREVFREAHDAGRGLLETRLTYRAGAVYESIEVGLDGRLRTRRLVRDDLDAFGNATLSTEYDCPPGAADTAGCSVAGVSLPRNISYYPER